MTTLHKDSNNIVPMFLPQKMEQPMAVNDQTQIDKTQTSQQELSFFDVKELYDLAYAHEGNRSKFKVLLADAVAMDIIYRRQLAQNASYKAPLKTTEYDIEQPSKKAAQQ